MANEPFLRLRNGTLSTMVLHVRQKSRQTKKETGSAKLFLFAFVLFIMTSFYLCNDSSPSNFKSSSSLGIK